MDSGLWCLRDFSRRAYRAGFHTFRIEEGIVSYEDDVPLGSIERRNSSIKRSIAFYRERWGETCSFCVHFPKDADVKTLGERLEILHRGARQGHYFTVLAHARLYRELTKAGYDRIHENIRFSPLPLIFENRAIARALAADDPAMSGAQPVTGIDGIPFPAGIKGMPFAELEQMIAGTGAEKYGA